jgi:hypothetical protein
LYDYFVRKFVKSPTYNNIPVSRRSAELLAVRHGFANVEAVIGRLKAGARILDVGAGRSGFGAAITVLRPDIEWVNFDPAYSDPTILREASDHAPTNLKFVAGSIATRGCLEDLGPFDYALSYWCFPYLARDPDAVRTAAAQMYDATVDCGHLSIGPERRERVGPYFNTIRYMKNLDFTAEEFAAQIIARVYRLPPSLITGLVQPDAPVFRGKPAD